MKSFDVIVLGAGISGATVARLFAESGQKVLVVEKEAVVGGKCYDYYDKKDGVTISKYGPHIFHTNNEKVWNFVNRFAIFIDYDHKVKSLCGQDLVQWPVNMKTLRHFFSENNERAIDLFKEEQKEEQLKYPNKRNFEEAALAGSGKTIYEAMIKNYTEKHWGMKANKLDASLFSRLPINFDDNDSFFRDKYQGLPAGGYTEMIAGMLSHENIQLSLCYEVTPSSFSNLMKFADTIVSTIPPSSILNAECDLPYRSIKFVKAYDEKAVGREVSVINYPGKEVKATRSTDYAVMWGYKDYASHPVIYEIPAAEGEEFYPIPTRENREKADKAISHLKSLYIISAGRLGKYKYFNMDAAIADVFEMAEEWF